MANAHLGDEGKIRQSIERAKFVQKGGPTLCAVDGDAVKVANVSL